jgi:hypothetical protein
MAKIFLSYRREDTAGIAGRIYDRLRDHFGNDAIFMDIDSIPLGVDFQKHIDSAVGQCDLVLAVIGTNWAGEAGAQRRIDNPEDFVRVEIEAALNRDIPVIPILIDRTQMPTKADLPPSIARLTYRNATDVDQGRHFHAHVDLLIKGIEFHFQRLKIPAPLPTSQSEQELPANETSACPLDWEQRSTKGQLGPVPAIDKAAIPRGSTAAHVTIYSQRPAGLSQPVNQQLEPSHESSGVPNSLDWRSPRLTQNLGSLHFFEGVLGLLCGLLPLVGLWQNLSGWRDHILELALIPFVLPLAALQIVGAFGMWNRKPWSRWLACYCASLLVLVGGLLALSSRTSMFALMLSPNLPIVLGHLWLRPKLVARVSS